MNALIIAMTAKSLNEVMMARFRVTRFSTEECMILVSEDGTAKVIIENGKANVFSTKDNLTKLNSVSALATIDA